MIIISKFPVDPPTGCTDDFGGLSHICRTVKATRQLLHSNKQEWQVSRPAGLATRATSRSSSTEWFHATRPPIPMSAYGHPHPQMPMLMTWF